MEKRLQRYKAIDFFCGGGGMTYGLRQAGIDVIAGVDIDKEAKATYEHNNKGTIFIEKDIKYALKIQKIQETKDLSWLFRQNWKWPNSK